MRLALEEYDGGISFGGKIINKLRYADDNIPASWQCKRTGESD